MYIPANLSEVRKDPFWPVVVAFTAVAVFILFVLSEEAAAEAPAWIVSSVASVVPSAKRWAEVSEFPHRTALFWAYIWLAIPVMLLMLVRSRASQNGYLARVSKHSTLRLFGNLFLIVVLASAVLVIGYYFALVDTPGCSSRCVNSSRGLMMLFGVCYLLSVASLLVFGFWNVKLILDRFAARRSE